MLKSMRYADNGSRTDDLYISFWFEPPSNSLQCGKVKV